jgi:hypothetical protein
MLSIKLRSLARHDAVLRVRLRLQGNAGEMFGEQPWCLQSGTKRMEILANALLAMTVLRLLRSRPRFRWRLVGRMEFLSLVT